MVILKEPFRMVEEPQGLF